MVWICCPYCGKKFIEKPEDERCPECGGVLSWTGSGETTRWLRRIPWIFFGAALLPCFLTWIAYCPWLLQECKDDMSALSSFFYPSFTYAIMNSWGDSIMPEDSLFINYKERILRSYSSGCKICFISFAIIEVLLFGIDFFLIIKQWVIVLCHLTSAYYFILGIINVLFHDIIQFDVIKQRVEDIIYDSKRSRRHQKELRYILFQAVGAFLWFIVYRITRFFGMPSLF